MKRAFLFPGQGSQFVGMGKDIYDNYEIARKIYKQASDILKIDTQKLCFEGPEEKLNKTENTQIAILVTSLAILKILKEKNIGADIAVGLSLGEYTALIYSGIITLEDGIKLIQKRGYYMQNMLPKQEYLMVAVIGLETEKIEDICNKLSKNGKFAVPSNYNCSVQTVISGEKEAIEEAIKLLQQAGARKVIPLKTNGPFHTIKLEEAKKAYEKELEKIKFHKGNCKVIKNLDGTYYQQTDSIKDILANHITHPVRFDKAIKQMQKERIEEYVEIGPGKVLTGFVKKEQKEADTFTICSLESLEEYLKIHEKERK